ncbi:unnamed protein product [Prunus armeniaca]
MKGGEHGKHPTFNKFHSCQLITNGILVKNIREVINKRKEDELQREKFKLQQRLRLYKGPKIKCMATKESVRYIVKFELRVFGRGRNINKATST